MSRPVGIGDRVHTTLGKGVVREIRNHGRLLVDVSGRAVVLDAAAVKAVDMPKRSRKRRDSAPIAPAVEAPDDNRRQSIPEIDLHGLTVNEALTRAEEAISDALLADAPELRLIDGRSGGRIRAALHARLRGMASVRLVRIDPRNAGVTIVSF